MKEKGVTLCYESMVLIVICCFSGKYRRINLIEIMNQNQINITQKMIHITSHHKGKMKVLMHIMKV